MNFYLLLCILALITFLNRYGFLMQSVRFQPSEKLQRFLSFSMYAILTAIWAPFVFSFSLEQGFSHTGFDYMAATLVAAVLTVLRVPSVVVVVSSALVFASLRLML